MLGKAVEIYSMTKGHAALAGYLTGAEALTLRDYIPLIPDAPDVLFAPSCRDRFEQRPQSATFSPRVEIRIAMSRPSARSGPSKTSASPKTGSNPGAAGLAFRWLASNLSTLTFWLSAQRKEHASSRCPLTFRRALLPALNSLGQMDIELRSVHYLGTGAR